jgi:hypothetical protein
MIRKIDNTKNVTFTLPVDLIEKLRKYARDKEIPSINAGVREALAEYSIKIEQEILHKKMKEASKDRLFMKDLEDSMKDFEGIDNEMDKEDDRW